MKYCIIGWTDKWSKRGAYAEAENLKSIYNDVIDLYDGRLINKAKIDELHSKYGKLIYTYQNTNKYRDNGLLDIKYAFKDIVFCRKEKTPCVKYKSTNGFSIYKHNKSFINFVPMILPTFNKDEIQNIIDYKTVIGYYYRPQYRPDDLQMFCDFIKSINFDVELYVMGGWLSPYPFNNFNKHIKKMTYTKDNVEFWNNVTHYVYSESNVYDPYPTTLQEAVNLNKQIVILEQQRNFKDGITDIEEIIDYHKNKIDLDVRYDNADCILNNWKYDKFYNEVFNNDFIYNFDRDKYDTFEEWLEKQ